MKKHTLDYADVIVGEELRKKREEKVYPLVVLPCSVCAND